MNLFDLFVRISVKDEASDHLSTLSSKLSTGLQTAAKIGVAAVGAASSGIIALTKSAVDNYAEYEQLVGGVQTLFKDNANILMTYASEAYKNAGVSANEYMNAVTSFSAALISSLGGDTEAAAEYADRAMVSMADNANKMGTSMEMIQNAYQGFAKQNYTMLDNLKLGYGGTQAEMQRLIADAAAMTDVQERLGITVDESSMSFDNIVNAIEVMQSNLGIAGATADEAMTTISGSIASTKALWSDFITSLADGNADYQWYVNELVNSVGTVLTNVAPVAQQVFWSLANSVQTVLPELVSRIPSVLEGTIFAGMQYIFDTAITMLPLIIELGLNTITSLAQGIADNLPTLVPSVVSVILQIVDTLTNPDSIQNLVTAALAIVVALAEGLINAMPELLAKAPVIIANLVEVFISNAPQLLAAAGAMVVTLITGIGDNIPAFLDMASKMVVQFVDTIKRVVTNFIPEMVSVGKNIVNGVWKGIQNMASTFKRNIKNFFSGIVSGVKQTLGIHSPSTVFAGIGGYMVEGLAKGWDDEYAGIKKGIMDDMRFDVGSVNYGASGVGRAAQSAFMSAEQQGNMTIVVQSVLDGKIIGESTYAYHKNKERMYGMA